MVCVTPDLKLPIQPMSLICISRTRTPVYDLLIGIVLQPKRDQSSMMFVPSVVAKANPAGWSIFLRVGGKVNRSEILPKYERDWCL